MSIYSIDEFEALSKRNVQFLSESAKSVDERLEKSLRIRKASASGTVFLSHSSKDTDLLKSVTRLLVRMQVTCYIDKFDEAMPSSTSAETARRLKDQIRQCSHFLVLVTDRSRQSRWVPWELGFADAIKHRSKLAILPASSTYNPNAPWVGDEYFGLYPKVESGYSYSHTQEPTPVVNDPDTGHRVGLKEWLDA